ncbi:MAG: lytic transglycosylase domain-containing protein [Rhodobacter sp.]|jgi:hypothetical protein|nr:lytic transglycosylase domain-containing protein [Rhodobacter sp.]
MRRAILAIISGCAIIAGGSAGHAGDPKPFAEFTFKRVKLPKPGVGHRITVQIEPQAEVVEPASPDTPVPAAKASAYDWYWTVVSPSMAASGPGRLPQAVLQLDKGPGVPTPRLQALQQIMGQYSTHILTATIGTQVSPALVLAVISAESTGRSGAVSSAGATGLMQLMPDTASRFGVTDITDPADNIRGGVAYLDWLMGEFDGDPLLVLAGYNAGENAVRRYEGVPPFAETRAYVPKVLAAWTVARGLCLTPPELISDGCAFTNARQVTDG